MNVVSGSASRRRWRAPTALGVAAVVVAGAGWFGLERSGALGGGAGMSDDVYTARPVADAAAAKVSIANGASGVTPDTPVVLTAAVGETIGSVTVTDAAAHAVPGTFSADRRTWTSAADLRTADSYELTAETGDPSKNGVGLQHETFSTVAEDNNIKFDDMYPIDGSTVGVGEPVVLDFEHPIPKADRASVEHALTVYSSPQQQPGSWGWLSSQRVDYRPQNYWQPGTKVHVAMALNGVSVGGGQFGAKDHTLDFAVGRDQETVVNVGSDQATVYRDGQSVHSFAVSGGMPGLDTWGGTFAVIDKAPDVRMDSRSAGLGDEYDIPDVKWDVHFTYSGSYVHSAPWSVSAQGVSNVSHGCVGTNPQDAEWFFDSTLPGDIIRVTGSPRTAALGNGFNDWQDSWTDWQAMSAA